MSVAISSIDRVLLSFSQVLGSGRDEIDGQPKSIVYRVSLCQKRQRMLKRSARYKRYLIKKRTMLALAFMLILSFTVHEPRSQWSFTRY